MTFNKIAAYLPSDKRLVEYFNRRNRLLFRY
nr:MAG TPA: hypothetical protein [Bacteriophage sp.]DAP50536.1 MAG TPA: hypothetical protein [Caudoviricetes sp.]DAQ65878.1 MAG TPA: hypothetical protein [Bacteriophage sp.]